MPKATTAKSSKSLSTTDAAGAGSKDRSTLLAVLKELRKNPDFHNVLSEINNTNDDDDDDIDDNEMDVDQTDMDDATIPSDPSTESSHIALQSLASVIKSAEEEIEAIEAKIDQYSRFASSISPDLMVQANQEMADLSASKASLVARVASDKAKMLELRNAISKAKGKSRLASGSHIPLLNDPPPKDPEADAFLKGLKLRCFLNAQSKEAERLEVESSFPHHESQHPPSPFLTPNNQTPAVGWLGFVNHHSDITVMPNAAAPTHLPHAFPSFSVSAPPPNLPFSDEPTLPLDKRIMITLPRKAKIKRRVKASPEPESAPDNSAGTEPAGNPVTVLTKRTTRRSLAAATDAAAAKRAAAEAAEADASIPSPTPAHEPEPESVPPSSFSAGENVPSGDSSLGFSFIEPPTSPQ